MVCRGYVFTVLSTLPLSCLVVYLQCPIAISIDLGLYSTTVRLAATNEVATYSNGSLAQSRIINAARSPQAVVSVLAKFASNTNYAKIELFKKAVEKFIKDRYVGLIHRVIICC